MTRIEVGFLFLAAGLAVLPAKLGAETEAELEARAAAIHARIFTLDSMLDTPTSSLPRPGWDMGERHDPRTDFSQCDFPRMRQGGLKAGVFAAFVAQGPRNPAGLAAARDRALAGFFRIRGMVAAHPADCALALTADDGPRIAATGRRAIYLSLENGYGIGRDLSLLQTYYELGMRFFLVVHNDNNDLGDSSMAGRPEWGGLSPLGKQAVEECNRLGIVVDASHAADATQEAILAISRTPIILSHSGCRAITPHPRNATDAFIRKLAAKGGVIQINAVSSALRRLPVDPARNIAFQRIMIRYGTNGLLSEQRQAEALVELLKLRYRFPDQWAAFDDFLRHLFHALDVAGVDHVGIGTDMDNGGGVIGMEDVSGYGRITLALVKRGYSEADIAKIWGGNLLRVMRQAEEHARDVSKGAR